MAAGGSPADDGAELEFMRQDSSWHPCKVSPSITGDGLVVDFGSQDAGTMTLEKEEALEKLRIRSVPLQGDDCSQIDVGQHVLAICASKSKGLFYDAEVKKVLRVRHSKRAKCRCTFKIKWLCPDVGGDSVTVPSNSVLKLATRRVKDHAIVSEFLSSVNSFKSFAAPFHSVLDESDFEMNLQLLLEKQLKDIVKENDAFRKEAPGDILLDVEDDSKKHCLSKPDEGDKKVAVDMEAKELSKNRSCLSPLAARAALASLRSKWPQELDLSVSYKERDAQVNNGSGDSDRQRRGKPRRGRKKQEAEDSSVQKSTASARGVSKRKRHTDNVKPGPSAKKSKRNSVNEKSREEGSDEDIESVPSARGVSKRKRHTDNVKPGPGAKKSKRNSVNEKSREEGSDEDMESVPSEVEMDSSSPGETMAKNLKSLGSSNSAEKRTKNLKSAGSSKPARRALGKVSAQKKKPGGFKEKSIVGGGQSRSQPRRTRSLGRSQPGGHVFPQHHRGS